MYRAFLLSFNTEKYNTSQVLETGNLSDKVVENPGKVVIQQDVSVTLQHKKDQQSDKTSEIILICVSIVKGCKSINLKGKAFTVYTGKIAAPER